MKLVDRSKMLNMEKVYSLCERSYQNYVRKEGVSKLVKLVCCETISIDDLEKNISLFKDNRQNRLNTCMGVIIETLKTSCKNYDNLEQEYLQGVKRDIRFKLENLEQIYEQDLSKLVTKLKKLENIKEEYHENKR